MDGEMVLLDVVYSYSLKVQAIQLKNPGELTLDYDGIYAIIPKCHGRLSLIPVSLSVH